LEISKNKTAIIFSLVLFCIISILAIYSTSLNAEYITKQVIWYAAGFLIIIFVEKRNIKKLIKHAWFIYIITNIVLLLLLIIGKEINGSKSWFIIPGVGSIQPSEFAKISLILINIRILTKHKGKKYIDDIKLFFKIMLVTIIPGILTFLQPDTGIVIIYFLISLVMLYVYGIRKGIFIVLAISLITSLLLFALFYFCYQDTFINIFGTSFFYRIDRLINWSNNSGMQLTNSIAIIKAAGLFGFGIGNTPLYIPEAHTDFIFSIFANNFGLVGILFLIGLIIMFDYNIYELMKKTNKRIYKYLVIGFLTIIIYQQIQNIGMNIGLLPITGITLPFISYGGSSLLSYMIMIGIIKGID